jgi:hypothetical protein
VENVVATIDTPTSHQGAARPDVKNSAVLDPPRRVNMRAGRNATAIEIVITVQSRAVSVIAGDRVEVTNRTWVAA